jgi:hypothetical protein
MKRASTGQFLPTPKGQKTPKMKEVERHLGRTLEEDFHEYHLEKGWGQKRIANRWGVPRNLIFSTSTRGGRRSWVTMLDLPVRRLEKDVIRMTNPQTQPPHVKCAEHSKNISMEPIGSAMRMVGAGRASISYDYVRIAIGNSTEMILLSQNGQRRFCCSGKRSELSKLGETPLQNRKSSSGCVQQSLQEESLSAARQATAPNYAMQLTGPGCHAVCFLYSVRAVIWNERRG